MTRFRRRTRARRGFRPQTDWAAAWQICGNLAAAPAPGECDVFNLSEAADPDYLARPPETVRRIRGSMTWLMSEIFFSEPQCITMAIGIGVATPQAVDALAVPCPVLEAHWDGWMYHRFLPFRTNENSFVMTSFPSEEIDSRAQRKLEDNALFLAVSAISDAGVFVTVGYNGAVRWLLSASSR